MRQNNFTKNYGQKFRSICTPWAPARSLVFRVLSRGHASIRSQNGLQKASFDELNWSFAQYLWKTEQEEEERRFKCVRSGEARGKAVYFCGNLLSSSSCSVRLSPSTFYWIDQNYKHKHQIKPDYDLYTCVYISKIYINCLNGRKNMHPQTKI